jgi:hypothetical protein
MLAGMHGSDVLAAADSVRALLAEHLDADWTVRVPDLDLTVASALAHGAETTLWYAVDLWGGIRDESAFELRVRPDAPNRRILSSVVSAARTCAASVDAAPDDLLGFHPFGAADRSGFAAMACDEVLVHGDDAARGLGLHLDPDRELAARVLARLYPWHDVDGDPWPALLWANGRVDLPGRPFQHRWRWHAAPLAQWDGAAPVLD